ncbi:hypothetical protein A3C68_01980 [Candidatus Kuenenbacteria bacterium RIFCSPHIGHO2_02_FULL_42_29]|nr:MAG: hypothetical protein A3C68_01980 [Candidatus Kuenenbacteria bacterium RIFCSPHIGHO2_02_FULL_42_29]
MSKVTIIIATWNSEKFLSELFLSLHAMDYPKSDWDLIAVDNGSTDNTLRILDDWQKKMFNFTTIIRNESNVGFSAGYNQGINYALKQNPNYMALLNDDTVVTPSWLKIIIDKMEIQPEVGLCQPLITRYPERDRINSFGNCFHYLGFGYSYGENQSIKFFTEQKILNDYAPAYLSFTAVVIRRSVFDEIGFLDEKYFAYHEDSDFCFRSRLADWRLLVASDSIVHHHYKFPSLKNKQRYFWLEKNRLYLVLKFYKPRTLLLIFPAFLIMEFGLIIFSILRGFFFYRLKAYAWIISSLPKILKSRRQIQSARKFGDYKLFDFMTGTIEFQAIKNPLLDYVGNPVLNLYFKLIERLI